MKTITRLMIAIGQVVLPLVVTAQTPVLLRTFNNPTPNADDNFGSGVSALGDDRILIGARYDDTSGTNAGAVYLFHTNGTLLTTFANPNPASGKFILPYADEQYGSAIAALGSDRVVIGSLMDGKVYLFATNGALVTTITNPSPYISYFGHAVAAFGNDKVIIGAPMDFEDFDTYDVFGAAYLYSTNGTRLATFINFTPGVFYGLGVSVAAFGSDRVLIGTSSGLPAAALFNTNGTLLTIFTIPASTELYYPFGHPVAAAGTDRVLVGAPGYDMNSGAVHLFNTNGTFLLTITNPTPAAADFFGARIAMLGNDRVIIGARGDNATGPSAGSAYVFDLTGTLLATINNPAPASGDAFGYRVAAFGSAGAIIGATWDDAGAPSAGSVYLFSIPSPLTPPSLTIRRTTTNTIVVSWPASTTNFVLQQNTNGLSSLNWSNVTAGIQNDGTNKTFIVNPTGQSRFFRLMSP